MTEAVFQAPKRRARVYEGYNTPLPVPLTAENDGLQPTLIYKAEIVNQHVVVRDPEHIQALYGKGYFGKGILSRSRPDHSISLQWEKFGEQVLPVISLSKYQKHMSWARDVLLAHGLEEEVVNQTLQRLSQPIEPELSEKNGHNECPASPRRSQDAVSGEPQYDALEQTGTESQGEQDSDSPQSKRPRRQGDVRFDPLAELYHQELQQGDKAALVDRGHMLKTLPAHRQRTDMEYVLVFDQEDEQKPVVKHRTEPGNPTGTTRRVCRINPFRLLEYLQLTREEAFFLVYGLGCLSVYNNEEPLSVMQLWQMFRFVQPHFETSYIAYHFFRSRGWVPKPGVKYGTDLMLYRKGPPFYHASYSVVVEKVAQEKVAQEKVAQEKVDQEKVDQEKVAQEKVAQEKVDQEKVDQEKVDQEKVAQEKVDQEKVDQEKVDQEKVDQEKVDQEKVDQEKVDQEKVAQEKVAQEKVAQEKVAQEKVAQEKVAQEKVAQEKVAQEKVAQEKVDQAFSGATLRPFSWRTLAALSRITGNVSKELMLCFVIYPSDMKEEQLSSPNCISDVTVQEIILSRWISSQERTDMEDI
ncbi:hypothetical protein UPYG_G00092840 [Umbra pygmaea]|uniref:tRNA-intron lyase n=1 Tax=Umbra pygmaea TaxID=75934 RepID=A0ABD0XGG0_UMBPY